MSIAVPPPALLCQADAPVRPAFVATAAVLSALLGILVLLGWAFDVQALRSVVPGAVQMKANTAVALVAASAALWLAASSRTVAGRRLALALAALVASIGLATAGEYAFGWELGIDELVFRDTAVAFNLIKGRMSPLSAVAFAALGIALAGLAYRAAAVAVQALAGLVCALGAVSFLGYLWNASEIVGDRIVPPVAVNTAWAFILLGSAAVVASRRREGEGERPARSRTSIEAKVLGGFIAAALLVVVGGGYTYRSGAGFAQSSERVTRAHDVRAQLGRFEAAISDAESAQRLYLLLNKPAYRQAFAAHALEMRRRSDELAKLLPDSPSQLRVFERLRLLGEARLARLEHVVAVFESSGEAAARIELATERGIQQMQEIHELMHGIDVAEVDKLRAHELQSESERQASLASLLITLLLTTGLFVLLFRSIRSEMHARNDAERESHRLNASLERRVEERTAELSFQRAFLRKIIDLNRSFIFAKDRDGRFVLANQAAAEAYGTTVEAIVGKTTADLNPSAEAARQIGATEREVFESGREIVIEEDPMVDATGAVRWLHSVKRPILTPDGKATLLLGVGTDITARKAAEDEARRLAADLERRVEKRTQDLQTSNVQLEQARFEAEEANRAKSAFLATMSHEIRTPMNGVIGMVEVLAQSSLNEAQREAVQTIRSSSFTLLGLIDDVLDFSKIEAGRLDLERTPVHLAELVEGLCRSMATVAAAKGVCLRVFVDPRLPERLWADPTRLRQVLTNLVGNAIKFSGGRDGHPGRVVVRAQRATDDPLAWTLQVADNGIGMSGSTLRHLFTSFAQGEASTTRRFGGTGLGLAISHRLVGLMGGSIDVQSTEAAGSAFTVRLPIDPVGGDAATASTDLSGLDCVVVESADLDVADLAAYLEPAGARVPAAADAAKAIAIARHLPLPVLIAHHERGEGRPAPPPGFARASDVRKVLLTTGLDASEAWADLDIVAVDGNGLGRLGLLRAVGAAAGRVSLDAPGAAANAAPVPQPQPTPTVDEARAAGRLILVAEDDAINRRVIRHQLALLGHAAEIVEDGRQALESWRRGGHALLLTDLHMPVMDGYTLAASIRGEERGRRLPIVALTANALRGEAARARAAGVDEYLTKPIQLAPLGAALAKWLAAERAPAPAVAAAASAPVFDVGVLTRLLGGDEELVREFLAEYRTSTETLTGEIVQAAARHDAVQVAACAHKLKSSSRSVGALALGDVCAALERAAIDSGPGEVAVRCVELETAVAVVMDRLAAHAAAELLSVR